MGIYEDLGVRPLIIIGRSDLIASCAANGTPHAAAGRSCPAQELVMAARCQEVLAGGTNGG